MEVVALYMQVNTTDKNLPMLGVYQACSVSSGEIRPSLQCATSTEKFY